jgi:DNA-binding NarL/FixJ family response regulator
LGTRILLVDDHQILRQGLKALLEREEDLQVVGEAADGRAAVSLARELHPQIVVMDVSMPSLNGIDATRQIINAMPDVKVLALSAHSDAKMVTETLKAGAKGFLLKDVAVDELVSAVRQVMSGQTFLSPRIAHLADEDHISTSAPNGSRGRLSVREREVLQLIAEGKATKEVAAMLGVGVKTAETHRRSIMEKLNIDSVAELTKYAIREGLTALEQ